MKAEHLIKIEIWAAGLVGEANEICIQAAHAQHEPHNKAILVMVVDRARRRLNAIEAALAGDPGEAEREMNASYTRSIPEVRKGVLQ